MCDAETSSVRQGLGELLFGVVCGAVGGRVIGGPGGLQELGEKKGFELTAGFAQFARRFVRG
jgi:hypothetical protein